ncbi:MAG: glycosyltransferase family 4 protein [bacterium]|nr:glycosyltransferase family 4 protein [bacterium]
MYAEPGRTTEASRAGDDPSAAVDPGRVAVLASHPVQYHAPLFGELARRLDIQVFYAHRATPFQQASAGFQTAFDWDLDLLSGYPHTFLKNVAANPDASRFSGCDTPDIGQHLDEGGFRTLLVTGWHLKVYWQGIWAARRRSVSVLIRGDSQLETPRSPTKRAAKRVVYPRLLRVFDAALYVGHRNRAYFEHYRYPERRLFHSPHCVDTERFAAGASPAARSSLRGELGIAPEDWAILFAGKLVPFKRPLDVVDAVAQLRAEGLRAHMIVAGSGPLEGELKARAAAAQVPLHLLGFRNQTKMPSVYAASDVLVLPSTGRETWGLVCNEALACGRPIVVSEAVGAAPDLLSDSAAGRTFPLADTPALADAIGATLHTPPAAEVIRRVSDNHSLSKAVDGMIDALKWLPTVDGRR